MYISAPTSLSLSSLLILSISYYYYYYLYHHIIIGISIFALTYFPGLSPFITLKSEIRCQTEFQTTLCRTSIPVSVSDGHHNHHLVIVTNFISINIIINTIQLHEDHQQQARVSDCIATTESLAILCLTPYSSDIFAIVCKFRDCISNWKNSGCVSIVCISFHIFRNFLFVKVSKLDHSYLLLLISLSLLSSFLRIF